MDYVLGIDETSHVEERLVPTPGKNNKPQAPPANQKGSKQRAPQGVFGKSAKSSDDAQKQKPKEALRSAELQAKQRALQIKNESLNTYESSRSLGSKTSSEPSTRSAIIDEAAQDLLTVPKHSRENAALSFNTSRGKVRSKTKACSSGKHSETNGAGVSPRELEKENDKGGKWTDRFMAKYGLQKHTSALFKS